MAPDGLSSVVIAAPATPRNGDARWGMVLILRRLHSTSGFGQGARREAYSALMPPGRASLHDAGGMDIAAMIMLTARR